MDSHGIFLAADSDHAANMAAENKTKLSFGFWTLLLAALMLAVFPSPGRGQTISATLSGFVYDQAGAVVPHAKIKLTNEASKDHRETISNGSGYFSFTAIPAATYSITVEHAGFALFEENGIVLHPADQLNLTNIKLEIGSVEMTVTVTAAPSTILTSGERSVLITADDIKHLPVEGRDATELIKILPGFSEVAQGAGADNLAPDPSQVGSQISSYSANGSTPEGISIVSDGVNITDPGGEALTDQVINMDNVQEVSVQTSNFGADSAKGPIVINAVGKSGGSEYHGSLYVYGRTYQMNTQDWFSKYDKDPKPQDRYIYPGGNIGGPVKIPGTNLNHNNKLVFFASSEDYAQREVYSYGSAEAATIYALLPTQNMRNGNFSASELSNYFGIPDNGASCNPAAGSALALYVNICNPASGQSVSGTTISNNQIPNKDLDAGAAAIMNNLVPLPNRTPFNNFGNYYNYSKVNLQNNDSFQLHTRVDYAFSDNAKLYVTYGFQHGSGRNPQQVYYSPQQPFGEIDTPDGILGQDFSHAASLNFTQVLSNSLTNEIFAGVNLNLGGNEIGKKGVDLSSTIGYPYQGIYNTVQYPQLYDYGYDGLPLALFPDYSSPIFQHKFIPNGGDNLTKVFKTHTIKTGFYIERTTCNETDLNVASNGQIGQYYVGPNNGPGNLQQPDGTSYPTPGNYLASFFEGEIGQFSQYNLQTNSDLFYWTVDSYVTDSWKYNKKLTLDIGFRLGHVGPWQDAHGLGMAVWKPGLYAQQAAAPVIVNGAVVINSTTVNPGYTWHALDKSIPNSGAGSTLAFFSPRFGLAYDLRGNGKTIIRGGIGAYRSHDAWNDVNQEQATAQGQSYATLGGGGLLLKNIPALAKYANVGAGNGTQGATDGVGFGLTAGDTEQPLTYTYSFGISQQLNSSSLFELNYQGSQSSHLLTQYEQGASGDLENIDALPIGTLYQPDPITGAVVSLHGISPSTMNDFRPYPFYSQVNVARHILYSNYNSLQTSIHKTQGSLTYDVNYTWSKNLGVLGSYGTGNVIDSGNIRPNYGPLAYDRSQVGKGTITYNTGSLVHGGRLIRGLSNNWEVSGIVVIQSGPNAQRVLSSNLNLGGNIQECAPFDPKKCLYPSPNGPQQYSVNNITYLGTPDVVLQPALTCDPRSGLAKHQYINVNCFRLPQFGENGPAEFPYIHAPGFFNADARVGKDLQLGGKKSLQFQLSAFNVINRPNNSFSSKFPTEQELLVTGNELNYQGSGSSGYAFPTDFGKANFRFGRRIAEIGIRYNF